MYQEITYPVLDEDIMARKRIFWTIEEHLYFVYYRIIYYQRIKVYRVERKDMVIFRCFNGVCVKCNPNKYDSTYCTR